METICRACGYQRKSTDQAPDWECPSCGKAYVKTSQDSSSPLVIYTDKPPSDSKNRPLGGSVYQKKPAEKASNKYAIFIGTVFTLFITLGIPILANPSSASDILLHSDVGFVSLICIALISVIAIARRVSGGVDSGGRKSIFLPLATVIGLIFTVLFFALAIMAHNDSRTAQRIQRNGQRAMADVVRIYSGACGKHSCSIYVEYAFTPIEKNDISNTVHGYANLGTSHNDAHINYARANKQVPIAYEVGHPEVSALNFDDDVFRRNDDENSRLIVLGKVLLGVFVLVLLAGVFSRWLSLGKKSNTN